MASLLFRDKNATDTTLFQDTPESPTCRLIVQPVDVQSDLLEDTAISMQRLNEMLNDHQSIPAQKVIVVLDSCCSGTQVGQKGCQIEGEILDLLFTNVQGRITSASCGRNESAYEDEELGHGVFSW